MTGKQSEIGAEFPFGIALCAVIVGAAATAGFDLGGLGSRFGGPAIFVAALAVGALIFLAGSWRIYRLAWREVALFILCVVSVITAVFIWEWVMRSLAAWFEPGSLGSTVAGLMSPIGQFAALGAML